MLPADRQGASPAFTGTRASYVALAAISTLAIALLSSIWAPDVSGSLALLGLLAVYLASSELLVLYLVFTPTSVVIDIIRLSVVGPVGGRGWLVFFSILEMLCKVVGTVFAWSLHRTITSGEGVYSPMAAPNYGQPPTYSPPQGFGPTPGGPPPSYSPNPNPPSYTRVEDPFAAAYSSSRNEPTTTPANGGAPFYSPPAGGPQQTERSEI